MGAGRTAVSALGGGLRGHTRLLVVGPGGGGGAGGAGVPPVADCDLHFDVRGCGRVACAAAGGKSP